MTCSNELVLMPSIRAQSGPNGGFVLTRKYIEGNARIAENWPGKVTVLIEIDNSPSGEFDLLEVPSETHGFTIEEFPGSVDGVMHRLADAAAVMGFPTRTQMNLARPCRVEGIPLVFTTEYSPETERQIMRASTPNPLVRLRRLIWLARHEALRKQAFAQAAGLQCSGTPTFELYRHIQPNAILFFDNRLTSEEIADDVLCEEKTRRLAAGQPLRLAFGGRFVPMKGVMIFPALARALLARGLKFTLDLYGDGPLKPALEAQIRELGLGQTVRLRAPLDFRNGWVPALREEIDLFVCSHIQGDPSSTYPEVMSCGVPIVGYDNVAFRGVVEQSSTGWTVPIGDIEALAELIVQLDKDRAKLAESIKKGRDFGRKHAFEANFKRRTEHLKQVARQ